LEHSASTNYTTTSSYRRQNTKDIHEELRKNYLVLNALVPEGYFAKAPTSPDCYHIFRDYCSLIPVLEFRFTAEEIQNPTMALRSRDMKKVMFLK
jgi:hypothetical protein